MNEFQKGANNIIDQIMQTAKAAVPESLGKEVKENIRAAILEVISDLDMVTREELEAQQRVLAKTRAKVDAMEAVIADLERQLASKETSE